MRSFIQNLPKEFQQIDVLVNNAGLVKGVDKVGDIKEDDLDEEAGDVDDLDPTAVDEKMWDGDGEEADKDQQGNKSMGKKSDGQAEAADENQLEDQAGSDEGNEEIGPEQGLRAVVELDGLGLQRDAHGRPIPCPRVHEVVERVRVDDGTGVIGEVTGDDDRWAVAGVERDDPRADALVLGEQQEVLAISPRRHVHGRTLHVLGEDDLRIPRFGERLGQARHGGVPDEVRRERRSESPLELRADGPD